MRKATLSIDGWLAILFAAIGGLVMVQSIALGIGSLSQPGAGLFPFFAALTILLSALIVLGRIAVATPSPPQPPFAAGRRWILFFLVAVFALWILVMPITGFVFGTFICVLAFSKLLQLEGCVKPVLLAAATSIGIYLLFNQLLQLDLPAGPWGV
jgi:putative tricarboxylic transport membrane protein